VLADITKFTVGPNQQVTLIVPVRLTARPFVITFGYSNFDSFNYLMTVEVKKQQKVSIENTEMPLCFTASHQEEGSD